MFDAGWKSSASAKFHPRSSARRRPTVVFPAPTTPITIPTILRSPCSLLFIRLLRASPAIGDGEGAIGISKNFDPLPFTVFFHVRDPLVGDIVVAVGFGGIVKLP